MTRTATPPAAQMTHSSKPAHERIAMRAYEIWLRRGCQHGCDQNDWLEAEAELMAEMSRTGSMPRPAATATPQQMARPAPATVAPAARRR